MVWNLITKHLNPHRNLVAALLEELEAGQRMDELESRLDRFRPAALNRTEQAMLFMVHGYCAFRRSDFTEALARYERGRELVPELAEYDLAIAQVHFFEGRLDQAWASVYRYPVAEMSVGHMLRFSSYAYLCSDYERGMWLLGSLIERYRSVVNLDPQYLMQQGLPPFSHAWFHAAAHYQLSGRLGSMRQLTEQLERDCFNYDFELAFQDLDAVLEEDYDRLLRSVRGIREDQRPLGMPLGFHDVAVAVFESFGARSYRQALAVLDAVRLGPHDFPGLLEVLQLARARLAHEFGEELQARIMSNKFVSDNPMLMPPDWAFQFGLLQYQELLKPRVRWEPLTEG
jgi:tetratricopeptide (TPR) repeat protein